MGDVQGAGMTDGVGEKGGGRTGEGPVGMGQKLNTIPLPQTDSFIETEVSAKFDSEKHKQQELDRC